MSAAVNSAIFAQNPVLFSLSMISSFLLYFFCNDAGAVRFRSFSSSSIRSWSSFPASVSATLLLR